MQITGGVSILLKTGTNVGIYNSFKAHYYGRWKWHWAVAIETGYFIFLRRLERWRFP